MIYRNVKYLPIFDTINQNTRFDPFVKFFII